MIYNRNMAKRTVFITIGLLLAGCILALAVMDKPATSESAGSDRSEAPTQPKEPPARVETPHHPYRVVASYPHDRQAFTQGLVYEDGVLYESTGLYGRSTLVKRDLKTGKALKTTHLARNHFGEGITIWGDKIIQLTWRNKIGFVYRKDTFTLLKEFTYPTEGWGITHDGKRLIYSDGTATLRFLDPNTFTETGRIQVRDQGRPVRGLNELEYVASPPSGAIDSQPGAAGPHHVFANVWPTDEIVVIDPNTGQVTARLDLSNLYPRSADSEDVLNGIAWIPETKHLLVTGKLWPKIYEIELSPHLAGEHP
ncbi:MAG TPA: glutaminyl-peptide cyclotransferase [Sedimentisphaerales bacterium]|nr:glutaminyl-peptide cyclotransferase [Sedimentisphaerales bacterium]